MGNANSIKKHALHATAAGKHFSKNFPAASIAEAITSAVEGRRAPERDYKGIIDDIFLIDDYGFYAKDGMEKIIKEIIEDCFNSYFAETRDNKHNNRMKFRLDYRRDKGFDDRVVFEMMMTEDPTKKNPEQLHLGWQHDKEGVRFVSQAKSWERWHMRVQSNGCVLIFGVDRHGKSKFLSAEPGKNVCALKVKPGERQEWSLVSPTNGSFFWLYNPHTNGFLEEYEDDKGKHRARLTLLSWKAVKLYLYPTWYDGDTV